MSDIRLPDGTILRGVPDNITQAELTAKLARNGYDTSKLKQPKFDPKAGPSPEDVERYKPEGGILENVGAGMNSAIQGVKQLFGKGESDADIEERRKLDSQLAEGQFGGGLAQTLGEMAITAPISMTAGGAAVKGLTSLPKVGAALKGAGAVGGRIANLGTVGRGALEGAIGGALNPVTSDESRGLNSAVGATVGAIAPAALGALGAGYRALSKSNATNRAAKLFEKELGADNIHDINFRLATETAPNLPLSTAARTQNPALATLERGARNRNTNDMGYNQSKQVAEGAWDAIQKATNQADELTTRVADREAVIQASKDYLDQFANPKDLTSASAIVNNTAEALRRSPVGRQNPDLTNLVSQTERMLAHPERTAGDYASQYWRLSKEMESPNVSPEVQTALIKLRDSVAKAADEASGGTHQFSDMLTRYKVDQGAVRSAEASKALRETFVDPHGVVRTSTAYNDTPHVTSSALRKAMASKGADAYGDVLEPTTRNQLGGVSEELARHEIYLAGNSPGQSQMKMNNPLEIIGSGRDNPFNYFPMVKGSANWLFRGSRDATTKSADEAMLSPQLWKKMMADYEKSKSPLSRQEYMSRALRQLALTPGRATSTALGD